MLPLKKGFVMSTGNSEVARIRAQIEQECESSYTGLHGLAQVGTVAHQQREACAERISDLQVDLISLVGFQHADEIVSDVIERYAKGNNHV